MRSATEIPEAPQRRPRTALLALAFFIFVPATIAILGLSGGFTADEQRTNTEFPDIVSSPLDEEQWAQAADWLEDRVPLREQAIALERQIANRVDAGGVNAIVESDQVSAGMDGWLFFNESIEQPCYSPEAEAAWLTEIDFATRILESTGRRFVIALAPDRETVVPELLGENSNECQVANRVLVGRLAERVNVLDLGEVVNQTEHAYRTDTHWSPAGALAGAEVLVKAIQPDAWGDPDIRSIQVSRRGDLERMLGSNIEEDVFVLTFAAQGASAVEVVETSAPNFPVRIATTPDAEPLNVVLIHDSYGGYESDGIAAGSAAEYVRPWFSSFANVRIPGNGAIVGEEPVAASVRDADVVAHLFVQRTLRTRLGTGLLSLPLISALLEELDTSVIVGQEVDRGTAVPPVAATGVLVIDVPSDALTDDVEITTPGGVIVRRINMSDRIMLLVTEGTDVLIGSDTRKITFVPFEYQVS